MHVNVQLLIDDKRIWYGMGMGMVSIDLSDSRDEVHALELKLKEFTMTAENNQQISLSKLHDANQRCREP
jgi:hypothetical protein